MVIGFDTEYQRINKRVDNNGKELDCYDNEILSYQYSCMIVDVDRKFSHQKWNGIVMPEGPEMSDRLTISKFVEFAIGHGISKFPDIKIPKEIYLVAHFTRADIPGFKDFKDFKDDSKNQRSNLNLENIRNTFVNVKQDIGLTLYDADDKSIEVKLNVKVRDTITLAHLIKYDRAVVRHCIFDT